MFISHNPSSFLTGDTPFLPTRLLEADDRRVSEELVFEPRHEGFIGIPHGGLGMGLCLDAWRRVGEPSYPVSVRYRFGGSGVAIGDPTVFSVERGVDSHDPSLLATITKVGDKTPYLRAEIGPAEKPDLSAWIPGPPANGFRELPYYRNCFVCGHHRTDPGLQRRFRAHSVNGVDVTSAAWNLESDERDRAELFLINKEELHPATLISIFDENTAWAGFMVTRLCGLSVRLEFTILRPVAWKEKLLFVGRPNGIRGNPKSPRFFLAEGAIYSMIDEAKPELVAFGKGEWVVLDQYTRQIKENLLPDGDWEWIFGP